MTYEAAIDNSWSAQFINSLKTNEPHEAALALLYDSIFLKPYRASLWLQGTLMTIELILELLRFEWVYRTPETTYSSSLFPFYLL